MGHLNIRTLTTREVEETHAIEEETSEEEGQIDETTLITPNAGELLVMRKALHVLQATLIPSQHEQNLPSKVHNWMPCARADN